MRIIKPFFDKVCFGDSTGRNGGSFFTSNIAIYNMFCITNWIVFILGRAVKQVSLSTSNESHHKNNKFAVGGSNEHKNNTINITNINTTHNNKQLRGGLVKDKKWNSYLFHQRFIFYIFTFYNRRLSYTFLILIGKWIFFDSTFSQVQKGIRMKWVVTNKKLSLHKDKQNF